MKISAALVGNQNSGKTTLFNRLTGSNQNVGNFPGVTVEKKTGTVKKRRNIQVIDLPGIYSLSPYSPEEIVTRDFLSREKPDIIINIVDATNIERNLYLTLQLKELGLPMVVALNMIDQVEQNRIKIDIPMLTKSFGIDIVPISASRNIGVSELLDKVEYIVENKITPSETCFYSDTVRQSIDAVCALGALRENDALRIPKRFAALKVLEGDPPMERLLELSDEDKNQLELIQRCLDSALDTDREAAFADMRYAYIDKACRTAVSKPGFETAGKRRSVAIDRVLTHKFFSIPIFFGIMFFIFWMTFGVFGAALSDLFESSIDFLTRLTDGAFTSANVNPTLHSLIIDGVFTGVGSVLSFLPTILVLFLFLSILEGTGYMARVAFIMDALLRKLGLSGRSIVPMLLGFGCSVPAMMATRTLPSNRDRKMTLLMIPFMSCSAKLPIYSLFTLAFFEKHQALVMMFLYLFGIVVSIIYAFILDKFYFHGKTTPFIMELPEYRLPMPSSVLLKIWENAREFMTKAFTIIFLASIVIWFLQRYDINLNIVANSSDSLLASLGRVISPVFSPLGFGDWRASTSLITGLMAKEAVVSTLAVLTDASGTTSVVSSLSSMFSPLTAFSFMVFTLLYMPCVAALAAMRRELYKTSFALYAMLYQTLIAWVVSFAVYRIGLLFV